MLSAVPNCGGLQTSAFLRINLTAKSSLLPISLVSIAVILPRLERGFFMFTRPAQICHTVFNVSLSYAMLVLFTLLKACHQPRED